MTTSIRSDQVQHTLTYAWDQSTSPATSVEYTDGTESRRNYVRNPSFAAGAVGWNTSGTVDTSQAHTGAQSMRMQTINGNTNYCYQLADQPVTEGDAWTSSVWVLAPADLAVTYYLQTIVVDANGVDTYVTSTTGIKFATDGWTRIALSLTVPTGGVTMSLGVSPSNETPGEVDTLYVDDFLLERSTVDGSYFDGDTATKTIYGQSTPLLIDGWQESVDTRNVVNEVVGGGIDYTLYPASLRSGQFVAVFQDEDHAAELVRMHQAPARFTIQDEDRPSIEMKYIANGTVTRSLDDDSRDYWLVTIPFQEYDA